MIIELSCVIFLVQDNARTKLSISNLVINAVKGFNTISPHGDKHTSLWECYKSNNTVRSTSNVRLILSLQKQYHWKKTKPQDRIKNRLKSGITPYKGNRALSTGSNSMEMLQFYF